MILLLTKIVVCTTFVKWRQIFSEQIVQFVLSVFTMQCVSPPSSNVSSWELLNDRACYRLHPKPAPSSSADPVSDRKINVQPSDKSPEGKEYARSTRFSNNTHTVESGNEGHINKRDKAIKAHWPRKWRWTSYLKALRQRLPGQRLSHCVQQCVAWLVCHVIFASPSNPTPEPCKRAWWNCVTTLTVALSNVCFSYCHSGITECGICVIRSKPFVVISPHHLLLLLLLVFPIVLSQTPNGRDSERF